MIDVIDIAQKIEQTIAELDGLRDNLTIFADSKVSSMTIYDREFAKTLIQLKNGVSFRIEKDWIQNPAVGMIDKIVKGLLEDKGFRKETADLAYKNHLKKIDIAQAQLNGYQSIYRNLSKL